MSTTGLLLIDNLTVSFGEGREPVLRGLCLEIGPGETVGIIGPSGSGKTTLARSILRILPSSARQVAGSIQFKGRDLATCPESELRSIRGRQVAMVFQEPRSALNPLMQVGRQIAEGLTAHFSLGRGEMRRKVLEMIELLGQEDAETLLSRYPHQLSGGQRQRVLLAGALVCRPELLVCDEPTAALDAVHRKLVWRALEQMQAQNQLSILLISHQMEDVSRLASRSYRLANGGLEEVSAVKSERAGGA